MTHTSLPSAGVLLQQAAQVSLVIRPFSSHLKQFSLQGENLGMNFSVELPNAPSLDTCKPFFGISSCKFDSGWNTSDYVGNSLDKS